MKRTQLLTNAEAAAMCGVSVATWDTWRCRGRFDDLPPAIRLGGRPKFRLADVEAFIERHAEGRAAI